MKIEKVLFIGLGGAGQRHLRILKELLPHNTIFSAFRHTAKTPLLRADFTVDRNSSINDSYQIQTFENIDLAFENKPDITVISTPTSCHRVPLMMAVNAGSGIIVEKPWSENLDGFSEFKDQVLLKNLPFLISFQRRYHPLIAKVKEYLTHEKIGHLIAASFNVYSDLTTWHGYENWRDLYAVRPELGGGVLLTEIHEIDLAYWFFGMPNSIFCVGGNRSGEMLDVEDTVQITLLYNSFSVQLTLCFMHKNTSRSFHIAGTKGDISWNEGTNQLTVNGVKDKKEEVAPEGFSNESMFRSQALDFISNWSSDHTRSSLEAAYASLAIVSAAKRSIQIGVVVKINQYLSNEVT